GPRGRPEEGDARDSRGRRPPPADRVARSREGDDGRRGGLTSPAPRREKEARASEDPRLNRVPSLPPRAPRLPGPMVLLPGRGRYIPAPCPPARPRRGSP